MKYIDEFRSNTLAAHLAGSLKKEAHQDRSYRFMEFCGGHTHVIHKYGIPNILPKNIELVHGPGCPVCVLPMSRIDAAVTIASKSDVIFCSFGDMLRVPASEGRSLIKARTLGADVRIVYSPLDVIDVAQSNKSKKVIFFAVGFETTTPMTAALIKRAKEMDIHNLLVFCNHVLTPPAIAAILDGIDHKNSSDISKKPSINGIIGPGHVSTIVGSDSYHGAVARYQIPLVISGFEPLDVMQTILMLVRQVNAMSQGSSAKVENEYTRSATSQGNIKARETVDQVFNLRGSFEWRGLGFIPDSALQIKEKYKDFDAEVYFSKEFEEIRLAQKTSASQDPKACLCADVLRGLKKPSDCPLFGKACTPDDPVGACMVSSEGACSAYWTYQL